MANEVVKYHNDMNTVALRHFNATEMNIFISICSKMKVQDTNIVEFSFDKIKTLIKNEKNYTTKEFGKILDNVYNKFLKTNIRLGNDRVWTRFVLFNEYTIDLHNQIVKIQINDKFKWVLNELTETFTRFELVDYVDFKSGYTKEFYRRMMQYKTTGIWKISLDEFRKQLCIPNSYATNDIDKKVLTPILKELKKEYKLKIEKTYEKQKLGRPKLSGYEFRFLTEEIKTRKQELKETDNIKRLKLYNAELKKFEVFNIITTFIKNDNSICLKLEHKHTKEIIHKVFNSIVHYTNFITKYTYK